VELSAIRQAVRDNYTLETVSTTVLDRRIAAAVREYSRYNPRPIDATFTTIADQAAYTLDVENPVLGVAAVLWFPSGEVYNELKASSEILYLLKQPGHYLLTSHRVIDDINESAHIAALNGDWEWREGTKEIILNPTPVQSGDTVTVVYWTGHALNEEEDGYDTIPDEDVDIIRDLTVAELLTKAQIEAAATPDYREGAEGVTSHFMGTNLGQAIDRLRGRLIGKYGGSAIVVGP